MTNADTEDLNRLRLAHAEAEGRFKRHLSTRSGDLVAFAKLEAELLEAERNLALALGEESAMPWHLAVNPSSLTALKLSDGLRTIVLFESIDKTRSAEKAKTAVLTFDLCLSFQHGWPNDEAIHGHRLHGKGLSAYGAFLVQNSKWLEELERRNRVHPNHKPEHFRDYKHYVLSLKDETIEVIARNASLEIVQDELFAQASKLLSGLHFQ